MNWRRYLLASAIAAFAVAPLSAWQARAEEPASADVADVEDENDPFEPVNRFFFEIHNALDHVIFIPVAKAYVYIVPDFAREGLRNILDNLNSPVIFANDVLQGEFDRAGTTVARFGINSTVGIGGLFDVASTMGLEKHSEDFGQTLGVWGVGEGPYLFLPVLGPVPPRDLIGRIADYAMDPLSYVQWGDDYEWVPVARAGLTAIDGRAQNLSTFEDIENTSVDYYASIRGLYRQSRQSAIMNGKTDVEDLPDFSDLDEPVDTALHGRVDDATN